MSARKVHQRCGNALYRTVFHVAGRQQTTEVNRVSCRVFHTSDSSRASCSVAAQNNEANLTSMELIQFAGMCPKRKLQEPEVQFSGTCPKDNNDSALLGSRVKSLGSNESRIVSFDTECSEVETTQFDVMTAINQSDSTTVKEWKSYESIPGPRGLPGIGNAFKYSKLGPYRFDKILDNRLGYMRKYGKIYKERLGTMDMVHIFEPSDIATMFRLEGKYPSRGLIANLELTYLQRNNKLVGFAFLDGLEWERQRSCIQRLMMEPLAAAQYLRWQWPVAQDFADYVGSIRDTANVVPDLQGNIFKYTMDSIGAVCFGERINAFGTSNDEENGNASELLPGYISETLFCLRSCMFNFPWFRYFRTPMYRRFETASNNMRQIMSKYIKAVEQRIAAEPSRSQEKTRSEIESGSCPYDTSKSHGEAADDMLDSSLDTTSNNDLCILKMLMQDPRVCPELAVNLVMALFRTGIDSTGNALSFFLHNLASNPDKQKILHEEIERVLPGDKQPTADDLLELPYLRASLRESFRLHYPVFGGSGRVMPEDTVFSGYKVPKGVFIFANMAAMSRMEEYFPRPLEFHPERWIRDERATLASTWQTDGAFISLPFSHGRRACPGKRFAEQGIYMAAIAIVRKYKLECDNKHLDMIHMPFTMPARPLHIRFISRQ